MTDMKLLSQANILVKNKDFKSAEKIYLELLAKNMNDDIVQSFLGRLYILQQKYIPAERILTQAYNKRKSAPTTASLALAKYMLKKYDEAVILYEELFKYDKDSPKIFERIIKSFRALKMYNFSHAYAQKLFSIHPNEEFSMFALTQSYMDTGDIKKAEEMCAKTIKAYPNSAEIWIIAGTLQEFTDCNEELAQECYRTAIDNGSKSAYYHLAVSLQKTGQFKEAETMYKKMIELIPQDEYSQASLGTLYLLQKNIKEGYKYFTKREKSKEIYSLKNQWDGKNYLDETLLLYCDQGLGDSIQFIRYLPYLTDKFKNISVLSRSECIELFEKNYKQLNNVKFYQKLSDIDDYDRYVLNSELPYYLDIDFDNIPFRQGYFLSDEHKTKLFKEKYFNTDKLKIGLCWQAGAVGMKGAIHRTIHIDYFEKILGIKNVQFYSFQLKDIFNTYSKYPNIISLENELNNFDDTAALMKNLDIMITVDTACLHLAGALGIKTFLLLPYCAEWRWFNNDKRTEWYESVEIFKQKERRDWFIETDEIAKRIEELINVK